MPSTKTKIKPLLFETYLTAIKNCPGSNLFQTSYAMIEGKKANLVKQGALASAFFTSSILSWFDLISGLHTTISGTIHDLEKSGWKKISKPLPGAVLIWESQNDGDGKHRHMGFYIGNNQAVSNIPVSRRPEKHHWTFGSVGSRPKRKVETIYIHPKLK